MSDDCTREGEFHMHSDRCYEAGRREVIEAVREAFDPGELNCGRLGFPCHFALSPDRWCRACRITVALGGPNELDGA